MSCTHVKVTRNQCHPSRQGMPQVKAAGMRRLELSASAGAWAGLRGLQEPNPSSNTLGKGKHGASFPASKINPARCSPTFPCSLNPNLWGLGGLVNPAGILFFSRKNLVLHLLPRTVPRGSDVHEGRLGHFVQQNPRSCSPWKAIQTVLGMQEAS